MLRTLKHKISSKIDQKRVLLVSLIGGIILTAIVQSFDMNLFEAYLYDLRVRNSSSVKNSELQTVIVNIDDQTIDRLNEYAPLSMKTHVELIKKISATNPKAIAYLLDFNDSVSPQKDKTTKISDADIFVNEAEKLTKNGTPVWLCTDVDVTGEVLPPFPLSKLPHRAALIHKDGTNFSEDKVTRRAVFSIYDEPVLHVQLASVINGKIGHEDYNGVYYMPEVEARYFLIHYVGNTKDHQQPFTELSAIDILEGKINPDVLNNKIILIGTKTKDNSSDYVYTPFSRSIYTNSKLVVHANILETLIQNNAIINAPVKADFIITLIFTCLVIGMVFRTTPEKGVISTIVGSLAITVGGILIFRTLSVWINLSHPLIGVWSAYYIFVPYRLIMEYKKRWDIQQKHEVLVQIEELKTNFMSLITHDLKTPVARIQGMAEILSKSGADKQVVTEIFNSTDELNRFITSILELARIEANHMQIKTQNKDINKIVEDCIQKFVFQADQRKISIKQTLEPLFPIHVDASLITKVVSNLIDNAIKYSPEGSSIEVTSCESLEHKGFVEVIIKDTGYGISHKDQKNIFSKFYRAKNDITMMTKGTGLGLYLSKYFVELHNGSLTLNSKEGYGSSFTILLPIDQTISKISENKTPKKGFLGRMNKIRKPKTINGGNQYV